MVRNSQFDGKAFGKEIVAAVKDHVANAVEPLREEIAMLQSRLADLEDSGANKGGKPRYRVPAGRA